MQIFVGVLLTNFTKSFYKKFHCFLSTTIFDRIKKKKNRNNRSFYKMPKWRSINRTSIHFLHLHILFS